MLLLIVFDKREQELQKQHTTLNSNIHDERAATARFGKGICYVPYAAVGRDAYDPKDALSRHRRWGGMGVRAGLWYGASTQR